MSSHRVREDVPASNEFEGDYIIGPVRDKWRVFNDGTEYSQVSGQNIKHGKVMRGADGRPAQFKSVEQARRWIRAGCPVTDRGGNEILNFEKWESDL